jgi:hypothetical protein
LVYAKLKERASKDSDVAIKIFSPGSACAVGSGGNEELLEELRSFGTDIILCPFLTAKVPAEIYEEVSTDGFIIHVAGLTISSSLWSYILAPLETLDHQPLIGCFSVMTVHSRTRR